MSDMKRVFLAGPFRAETPWLVEQNIRRAEGAALELWEMGYAVFCPHTNTRFYDKSLPDDVFLEGIKKWLEVSDIVVVLGRSPGVDAEVSLARQLGIPVYGISEMRYRFMFPEPSSELS